MPLRLLLAATALGGLCASVAPAATAAGDAQAVLDLPTNTEQRYLWLKGRQKVGETVLQLSRVPREDDEWAYVLNATRHYDHEGISQRSRGMTVVSRRGAPLRFEESTSLTSVQGARASQSTHIEFDGRKAHITSEHNGMKERRVSRDIPMPHDPTYLYANQALEHWVIFTAAFPREKKEHTVHLLYPDFDRVLEVTFRAEQEEELAIGKQKTKAQRYSFTSENKELTGRLWMDDSQRLLQLQFPAASLRLVLAPESSKTP